MKQIELRDLWVRFGKVQALAGVNLTVRGGRATMLIGPNGAGKSTVVKVLLGLVRMDAGELRVDGVQRAIDNQWKAGIGYLPESVAFSENLSGQQVMNFFCRARGVDRKRGLEVLRQVGLSQSARRRVRGYSRGMRQRLGLGIAILSQPELLFLDEPTGGLDQEGLSVLWGIMAEWHAAKRAVIVSTHDLALVERRVQDVVVLRAGQLIAQGTPAEFRLRTGAPHRVCFGVDDSEPLRVQRFEAALQSWGKATLSRERDTVIAEVPPQAMLELMRIQGGYGDTVRDIRVEEPTLDVVYDRLLAAG